MNDYEITIKIPSVPSKNKVMAELEMENVLKELRKLDYSYYMTVKKVGEWTYNKVE